MKIAFNFFDHPNLPNKIYTVNTKYLMSGKYTHTFVTKKLVVINTHQRNNSL